MNHNEKKSEDPFKRVKSGSVFSFLRAADDSPVSVPLAKPEPLTKPESPRPPQDILDLKKRLAEMELKVKQLEENTAKPSQARVEAPDYSSGIERRLVELESRLAVASGKSVSAPDLEENLRQMLKNAEGGLASLLEDYRSSGEEKSVKVAEMVEEVKRVADQDRRVNAANEVELARRLKALEGEFSGTLEQLSGALERTLKEGENALKKLLSEECAQREKSAEEFSVRMAKLEQEAASGRQETASALAELRRLGEENNSSLGEVDKVLEISREHQGVLERAMKEGETALKKLVSEECALREKSAEESSVRMTKLELEEASGRQETASALAELSRLAEGNNSGLSEVHRVLEVSRAHQGALECALKESENTLKKLLEEERDLREKSDAESAVRFENHIQETAALKTAIYNLAQDMLALKADILGAVKKDLNEGRDRLEALAGKMQGDIMATAGDKFSTLRSSWEAAAVEIHNAQKTAYCALEKCEKLDKSLFFLDHKTCSLERKYSRYIAEPLNPGGNGEERQRETT